MVCVLCQFDPPTDPTLLGEYSQWFTSEGLKEIARIEHLQELKVFRNFAEVSPQVTAMLFFPDVPSALRVAESEMWRKVAENLTR